MSRRSRRRSAEAALSRGEDPGRHPVADERGDDETSGTEAESRRLRVANVEEAAPANETEADAAEQRAAEQRLTARIVDGDQDASVELLEGFQGKVYRLVRRMWSRDSQLAEDLTQEVFLRVFRALPKFAGDCSLNTWIHRITVNVCISELRQRKALKRDRATISIDAPVHGDAGDGLYIEPSSASTGPDEVHERHELYAACRAAIDSLPEVWRVILTLRDIDGRSYDEIAKVLDLPIGTVRSRLHRARARVRCLIEQGGTGGAQ